MELKTKLKKVKGLGSAKEGVEHWWMQRVTAVALIPLVVWFVISVIKLVGMDYPQAKTWVQYPYNAVLLILLFPTVFYHAGLGLKVVIEDYVHNEFIKILLIIFIKLLFFVTTVSAVFAVLYINFKM